LPVLNDCWVYLAAKYAIGQGLTTPQTFGWIAVCAALIHLLIGWWLLGRAEGGALGTTSFALAGGLLLAFAAPMAIGHAVIATAMVCSAGCGYGLDFSST